MHCWLTRLKWDLGVPGFELGFLTVTDAFTNETESNCKSFNSCPLEGCDVGSLNLGFLAVVKHKRGSCYRIIFCQADVTNSPLRSFNKYLGVSTGVSNRPFLDAHQNERKPTRGESAECLSYETTTAVFSTAVKLSRGPFAAILLRFARCCTQRSFVTRKPCGRQQQCSFNLLPATARFARKHRHKIRASANGVDRGADGQVQPHTAAGTGHSRTFLRPNCLRQEPERVCHRDTKPERHYCG